MVRVWSGQGYCCGVVVMVTGMVAGMVTGRVQVLYRYGYVKVEGVGLGCVHSTVIVTDCCG